MFMSRIYHTAGGGVLFIGELVYNPSKPQALADFESALASFNFSTTRIAVPSPDRRVSQPRRFAAARRPMTC